MEILVKGYMIHGVAEGTEQLFALYPDGKVITCNRKFSNKFHEKDNKWEPTDVMPFEAIFIGKYKMPLEG